MFALTLTGSGEGWVVANLEGSWTLTQWKGSNVQDVRSHLAHVNADLEKRAEALKSHEIGKKLGMLV